MSDEGLFWEIVQTAPFIEADQMLRQRKYHALSELALKKDARSQDEYRNLISRINDELHRLNRINRDHHMQLAIKALFGESAWSDIKVWIEQNPIEQRKT